MNMFKKSKLLYLLALVTLLGGCLGENPFEAQRKKDDQIIKDYVAKNNLVGSYTTSGSGVFYSITTTKPTNSLVGTTNIVEVTYKLFNMDNIKLAESASYTFKPNVGAFMAGLSEGVALMRQGEKATFVVPSASAFGSGQVTIGNNVLPANSVVRVDVEVLNVRSDQQQIDYERTIIKNYFAKLTPPLTTFTTDSANVMIINQAPATAIEKLQANFPYVVNYTLRKAADGTVVDESTSFNYIHSTSNVISGFFIGMSYMRIGGRGYIGIPSTAGYGATGAQGKIAPYTPLIFEIKGISK